ncbi:MAG: DUF3892 domain-containing protein [Candidatus Woesearchaeota archaeon]
MAKKIICRNLDENNLIKEVGVESHGIYGISRIWEMINSNIEEFYTIRKGERAKVLAKISSTGRKYLTTSPDGITENNLEELGRCN